MHADQKYADSCVGDMNTVARIQGKVGFNFNKAQHVQLVGYIGKRKDSLMHLHNSFNFRAPRAVVFGALLDPATLQASIPGCETVFRSHEHDLKVRLALPIPLHGLQGPYDVTVHILEQDAPNRLVLKAGRTGRIGGTVDTTTTLIFEDVPEGTKLSYDTTVIFEGLARVADNPMFEDIVKHSLNSFLKKLNQRLVATVA